MSPFRPKRPGPPDQPGQLDLFDPEPERKPVAAVRSPAPKTIRSKEPEPTTAIGTGPELRERLSKYLKGDPPLRSVTLTRNRARIVSAKIHHPTSKEDGGLDVRIHRCFADADHRVLAAVAQFLDAKTAAARTGPLTTIREHFRNHGQDSGIKAPHLRPEGQHFNLTTLRDRVNSTYFADRLEVDITWGRGSRGGTRKPKRRGSFSIRLGSYDDRLKLVRIHPVLDRPEVPEYVVESIVYHEMLHAVVPPKQGQVRRSVHPPEFRRLERQYARFAEAEAWLDANVERLAKLR